MGLAEDADRAGSASPDHRRGGAAVVGCLERRSVVESIATAQFPAQRPHGGDLEGFGVTQLREDARQALREQGLARPGGSAHEEVVAAGGCDLETESGFVLTLDFGEVVESALRCAVILDLEHGRQWRHGDLAAIVVDHFGE